MKRRKTGPLTAGELRSATVLSSPIRIVVVELPDGSKVSLKDYRIDTVNGKPRLTLLLADGK